MKIRKINFKTKTDNHASIDLTRDGINPYLEYFIYGDFGSGKTSILKLIWECWQANLFHGEKINLSLKKTDHCIVEACFNDNQDFSFGFPSKTATKLILSNKVKHEETISNCILYYPSNREGCIDEKFHEGHVLTNCAIPIADLEDKTISNCCFLIDDICRGLDQSDSISYIREIIKVSKKNNNQIIMTIDQKEMSYLNITDRCHELEASDKANFISIMELSNKINKARK
jgi:recombinational DNA repair ATPase RecF